MVFELEELEMKHNEAVELDDLIFGKLQSDIIKSLCD